MARRRFELSPEVVAERYSNIFGRLEQYHPAIHDAFALHDRPDIPPEVLARQSNEDIYKKIILAHRLSERQGVRIPFSAVADLLRFGPGVFERKLVDFFQSQARQNRPTAAPRTPSVSNKRVGRTSADSLSRASRLNAPSASSLKQTSSENASDAFSEPSSSPSPSSPEKPETVPSRSDDEILLENMLKLADARAHVKASKGVDFDEAQSDAYFAVAKAMQRFRPEKGVAPSTYFFPTIEGEMNRGSRDRGRNATGVSRNDSDALRTLQNLERKIVSDSGRAPTDQELAARLKIPLSRVQDLRKIGLWMRAAYLSDPIQTREGNETLVENQIADVPSEEPEDPRKSELLLQVQTALEKPDLLTPNERTALSQWFILRVPQHEVARQLGVSQFHVSRLAADALEKIRQHLGVALPTLPSREHLQRRHELMEKAAARGGHGPVPRFVAKQLSLIGFVRRLRLVESVYADEGTGRRLSREKLWHALVEKDLRDLPRFVRFEITKRRGRT